MSEQANTPLIQFLYPGIRTRIIGPFLVVIGIVAIVGVYIVTRLVAGSLNERFNNQLLDSARAATNAIVEIETQQISTLHLMVFTEGVPEAIQAGDEQQLELVLRPVLTNSGADEVIVFDANRQGLLDIARSSSLGLEYTVLDPPGLDNWSSVEQVLAGEVDELGDKHVELIDASGGPLFYITAPVKDDDGNVVGGISLGMRLQRLVELISAQSLSSVALYDDQGYVLGSTFRAVSSDALILTPARTAQMANYTVDSSPVVDLELADEPYQVLYTAFRIRSHPLGLVAVGLPTNYIVEQMGTSRNSFALLFTGLFVSVVFLGFLAARTIVRPVRRLVNTTRAIRDGDLSRRVDLKMPDELGELSISFDHMTAQLVKRNEQIETLYLQQLRETAQREAVLANIGDAVLLRDINDQAIIRNQTAENLIELVSEDPRDLRIFADVCSLEEYEPFQLIELAGGYYSVFKTPVFLQSNELLGHLIVFRDMTSLVESERLKDELILQLSHELRTPLTTARGYVDLIQSLEAHHLSKQGQSFVANSLVGLTELERMINEVIDVSAIISNRFMVSLQPTNVAALVDHCIERWQKLAQKRGLTLIKTVPSEDLWVNGDEQYLAKVLDHLMHNACSYTLPGGEVELIAAAYNDKVGVRIIDDGVGIDLAEQRHVFERMYRGASAEAGPTDTRGLGLGLYLSKHIVEAHQGTIDLDSVLHQGTTVTVVLPEYKNGHTN